MTDEYSAEGEPQAGGGPRAGRRLWGGRPLGRRARWAVPAGAVVAVAAVVAGTSLAAGAQAAAPTLPARTPAELLADTQAAAPGPLSGTVSETANLGLPSIPGISDSAAGGSGQGGSGPASGLSLLTGTHTFNFWYADPTHVRVAEPVQLGESDLRRDGQQLWLWSSKSQTATHVVLPAEPKRPAGPAIATPATPLTPEQAARQVLAAVGPTTTVSVQRNIRIAGQDAYQLALAPKNGNSLVGQVRIAIAAGKYLPLRVQVFARGASTPAFQVGFTALSFGQPAASNFSFTPPPGAKVKTIHVPARPAAVPGSDPATKGSGSLSAATGGVRPTSGPMGDGGFLQASGAGRPTVLGHGWLSVLVYREGGVAATAPAGHPFAIKTTGAELRQVKTQVITGRPAPTGQVVQASQGPGSPMSAATPASPGPDAAILGALLKATTPVHGTWGSGRLLRTPLISVLVTSKGTVLVGAVTPSVLYSDAAGLK